LPVHTVGLSMPPVQVWNGLQLRPSLAQSNTSPQLLMACPQAQPSSVQLVPLGTHGGSSGASHWNGVRMPQNWPEGHAPPLLTAAQS
jgi:hypothetical protein